VEFSPPPHQATQERSGSSILAKVRRHSSVVTHTSEWLAGLLAGGKWRAAVGRVAANTALQLLNY